MRWPTWLTWYKKPEYRDIKEYSAAVVSGRRPVSPNGRKSMIPTQLKLERVLENKTCSPMSLYDFYMYLKHIELSEENLEFYIWYSNYKQSYDAAGGEKGDMFHHESTSSVHMTEKASESQAPSLEADHEADREAAQQITAQIAQLISSGATCTRGSKCKLTCADRRRTGNDGLKPAPYNSTTTLNMSKSGFHKELDAVAQAFLVPGALKELNIPPAMRSQALASIRTSASPSSLGPIANHVHQLLQHCSHRNFVRLGVSNGTFETVCVATCLGIIMTTAGYLAALLLAFTPYRGFHSRWTMLGDWFLWWLGMSLIMSGLRGSCFFLLLFSRRQPLPWERFTDAETGATRRTSALSRLMIFDRKLRVKDVHLRNLQHRIVLQSLVVGAAFASCNMLLFVCLPVWSTL